jgi:hypothetical protein
MPRVKGKELLCSCEKKYFKSIQGFGNRELFERYFDIDNLIKQVIDEKFQHFLAQPEKDGASILWFSKPYKETPRQLNGLEGLDFEKYTLLLQRTVGQFSNAIKALYQNGQDQNAEILENCLKYIRPEFVYCYDDVVVLAIWGMQPKESVRDSVGTVVKNLFKAKREVHTEPVEPNNPPEEPDPDENPDIPELPLYNVKFNAGTNGNLHGSSFFQKAFGDIISNDEIPEVAPKSGFEFVGWDLDPLDYQVNGDVSFTAKYNAIPPPIPAPPIPNPPWYSRFWNWLKTMLFDRGCLKWLLWILLLLFLFILLMSLLRGCNNEPKPIPSPIDEKPWIQDDPRVGDGGGIYDPGNPYEKVPTPPEYRDVLPPSQGELPPLDTTKIIRKPGQPVILGNRLNILMENEDKSIMDLAKSFKMKYPSNEFKIVYYDDVVKRMQIEFPPSQREILKSELPSKFAPEFDVFIFDESLFERQYKPNDPAFSSAEQAWYLNYIGAPKAWDITKGSTTLTIAIVDNGFSLNHPELESKVVMPYNVWLHSKEIFAQDLDHGTHVAATALALMDNNKGLCGVAPQCAFMPVQVADGAGFMTTTSILDGILYALYQGSDIINVSLGLEFASIPSELEQQNLQNNHFKEEERLWNKVMDIADRHNSVLVIAAGNENMLAGVNPMSRPKNFIVVSAVDKSNRQYKKAGFSNYGSFSTVSAPGVSIYSAVGKNGYMTMNGTSMAAPIVAGTVALMKSINPDLSAEQIACILKATGLPAIGKVGNLIQIDKALQTVKSKESQPCESSQSIPSTGDVQVTLSWDNYNDLDLVCIDPMNDTVWFQNKRSGSGGQLEIDMNANAMDSKNPIENIYWPIGRAPNGTYHVYLIYYKKHIDINDTQFKITVKYGGKTEVFTGNIKREDNSMPVCTFTLESTNNSSPSSMKNKDKLIRERENLKKRLNRIDRELKDY